MKTTKMEIELTFTEPLLGSMSGNRDLHEEFIASKAPTVAKAQKEVAAIKPNGTGNGEQAVADYDVEEQVAKAMTVFGADDHGLFIWDYQMKGHIKEQILALIELGEPCVKGLSKWTYKRAVNFFVHIVPRYIYLLDLSGNHWLSAPSRLQRPLRAETQMGERIALASSQMLPVGTSCRFQVQIISGENQKKNLAVISPETIKACLEFGSLKGTGQWRSGGYGRYTWRELSEGFAGRDTVAARDGYEANRVAV